MTVLLLTILWAVAAWTLFVTRDWPAIRAAIRQDPRAVVGYSLPVLAILVVCPLWLLVR